MLKNIIIRDLTEEDNEIISLLKKETGCKQASKAVMRAVYSFIRSSAIIRKQLNRIKELEAENYVVKQNTLLIIEATKKLEKMLCYQNNTTEKQLIVFDNKNKNEV